MENTTNLPFFPAGKNKPFYDSLTFESYTIHLWFNVQSYFSVTSVTLLLCVWSLKFFKIDQMAFQIKSKESILNVFQSLRTVTYCICNLKVDTCEVRSQVEKATKWVTISIIDNLTEQRRASKCELRLGSTCTSDEDLVWVVCKCFWMCGGSFTHHSCAQILSPGEEKMNMTKRESIARTSLTEVHSSSRYWRFFSYDSVKHQIQIMQRLWVGEISEWVCNLINAFSHFL